MYLALWLIRRWRLPATPCLILPVAVSLKRFLTPLLVFNLGIFVSLATTGGGRLRTATAALDGRAVRIFQSWKEAAPIEGGALSRKSVEQARHAGLIRNPLDRLAQQRGDGEGPDLGGGGGGFLGVDRIGDDELGQDRILHPGDGAAGEDSMGAVGDDVLGAGFLQRRRGVAQGAGRIDDVVDE